MKHTRPVHLHIDELVLAGFRPGDRHRIGDAVQRALAEMIASGALVLPPGARSRTVEEVAPQRIRASSSADARGVGAGIARSIVSGVTATLTPEGGKVS
jgi:hypothetical protein